MVGKENFQKKQSAEMKLGREANCVSTLGYNVTWGCSAAPIMKWLARQVLELPGFANVNGRVAWCQQASLQAAQKFVKFVSRVKIGFKFA